MRLARAFDRHLLRPVLDRLLTRGETGTRALTQLDRARVEHAVRRYGDFPLAYNTAYQPGLRQFGRQDGYIAWAEKLGVTMALGDPVCAPGEEADLVDAFRDAVRHPVFVQVGPAFAERLRERGFRLTPLGVETTLDIDRWTASGRDKERLRYAANWLRRRGHVVRELSAQTDLSAVDASWRTTLRRKTREMTFINRAGDFEHQPDVRRFGLYEGDGRLIAYMVLDPTWRDGRVSGYVTAIKRRLASATGYAEQGLHLEVIERLREERVERLHLGLLPLAPPADGGASHRDDPMLARALAALFASRAVNERVFNFQGHAAFKRRFRGGERTVYFASPHGFDARGIVALLRRSRMT